MRVGRACDDDPGYIWVREHGFGLYNRGARLGGERCAAVARYRIDDVLEACAGLARSVAAVDAADAAGAEKGEIDHGSSSPAISEIFTQRRSSCERRTASTTLAVWTASRNVGHSGLSAATPSIMSLISTTIMSL